MKRVMYEQQQRLLVPNVSSDGYLPSPVRAVGPVLMAPCPALPSVAEMTHVDLGPFNLTLARIGASCIFTAGC